MKINLLESIQQLVLDIAKVERYSYIVNTDRHENVVEHSFAIAMLCWRIFDFVKPPLDLEKIFKYALIHDFLERGQNRDVNAYATKKEKASKKDYEANELLKLQSEFEDFEDFTALLNNYEERSDEESLFVWSVDKMQQVINGQMDKWRPYIDYGVTYKQFAEKNEEVMEKCSLYVKGIFKTVYEDACKTYYDNPALK